MNTDHDHTQAEATLSHRLAQIHSADPFEIIFGSIDENHTLSTIYESYEGFFEDVDCGGEELIYTGGDCQDENEQIIHIKNKLCDSLPSTEWTNIVERILSSVARSRRRRRTQTTCNIPISLLRKVLDRSYNEETKSQAFEQLLILDELSANIERYNSSTKYLEKRVVLRARESQIRRRIFKLQGNGEGLLPAS